MTDANEQADPAERDPTDLEGPPDDEHLYEIPFGDLDDDLRPVCQGDVYSGICLPTYDGEHDHVILATHPCSMRAGARLRPRIQAFAVDIHPYVDPSKWSGGFKKVMPLPALTELELLEHWNEQHCAHLEGGERVVALAQAAQDFENYMTDDLRGALTSPEQIAAARIQIRDEARRRGETLRG